LQKQKQKPILFSTEMVRAIIEGRKTQTRRVIKPQPPKGLKPYQGYPGVIDCRPYQPGCILWVRETWADLHGMGFGNDPRTDKPFQFAYAADIIPGSDGDRIRKEYGIKWKPSIYMPRKAARLFLRAKNVRVERLQDISEEDAIAEGIHWTKEGPLHAHYLDNKLDAWLKWLAKEAFASLWNSINAKRGYGWETNPWVWVIEFENDHTARPAFNPRELAACPRFEPLR